jgi:acetylornithine deacetylase/succinyl-diaminopimelate desuccinylase-like protein
VDWFDELADFLRIPSISADPTHAPDVRRAAEWVCEFVRSTGGFCEIIAWRTQPIVVGEITASGGRDAPTVLCYCHFDVQPPGPLELWDSDPFEPELRGGYLYGRGSVDDKGHLYMLLAATRQLARAGELPVNVRFCCDGEEEVGGQSIVEFVESDERGADVAVIFDSGMIRRGLPAFTVATRGSIYFHVVVRTGERDLHSGLFGGAALNAAHALVRTLDGVVSHDGTLAKPLRKGMVAPTAAELADWRRELPAGGDELARQGARPKDRRAADEFYLRTFAEPALDVNGIATGSPHLQQTVVPVEAVANLSVRLAPGQRVGEIAPEVERLLRAAAPDGTDLAVELLSSAEPGLVRPDAPAIQLGLDAFERVFGARPALIRSGGSLPIVSALTAKGVPAVITGLALPDSQTHAPNERLVLEYMPLGIAVARELLLAFAAL